jgi:ribA/ribD-fused uncharacterized protein
MRAMPERHIQINSIKSLLDNINAGFRPDYLFFWGHQPSADGRIGPGCLSQWWPASFAVEGLLYATAEHYMMAEKARLFGDEVMRQKILNSPHPNTAKKLGREVVKFDEEIWREYRLDIVLCGNEAKFSQNDNLKAYLLSTQEQILVEASPMDRIWGIGLARDDPRAVNPEKWRGLNLLGFALMDVRARLLESAPSN